MWPKAIKLIVGAGVALLIVAGCGSGEEATTPAIAKAAYIRKAIGICKGMTDKLNSEGFAVLQEVEKETGKTGREAEAVFIPKWLVPAMRTEIEELRALGSPQGDEKHVDAIYEDVEEVLDLAESDPRRYLYLQANFKHPYRKAEKLAKAYGIEACGQP